MIRVLVVEDSATVRHRLRESSPPTPSWRSSARRSTAAQAVELCGGCGPDVITMDMMLPAMSGLAATEHIMADYPDADPGRLVCRPAGAVQHLRRARRRGGRRAGEAARRRLRRRLGTAAVLGGPAGLPDPRDHPSAGPAGRVRCERPGGCRPPAAAMRRHRHCRWWRSVRPPVGPARPRSSCCGRCRPDFRMPVLCVQHIAASEPFAWRSPTGSPARPAAASATRRTAMTGRASWPGRVVMAPPDRHLLVRDGLLRLSAGAAAALLPAVGGRAVRVGGRRVRPARGRLPAHRDGPRRRRGPAAMRRAGARRPRAGRGELRRVRDAAGGGAARRGRVGPAAGRRSPGGSPNCGPTSGVRR